MPSLIESETPRQWSTSKGSGVMKIGLSISTFGQRWLQITCDPKRMDPIHPADPTSIITTSASKWPRHQQGHLQEERSCMRSCTIQGSKHVPEALSGSGPENHRLSSQDWFNSLLVVVSMRKLGNIDLSPSSRGCNQHLGSSLQATTIVEAAAGVGAVVPATLPHLRVGKWNSLESL